MAQKRNPLIDLLKGFAITLVVAGHASQWFSGYDLTNRLFITIYSFHMPLFMLLSGYVCYNEAHRVNLKKRFQVLVVPFFVWFFINILVYHHILDYKDVISRLYNLIYDPATGNWFLWILFWICILLYFALKISKKHTELILLSFWGVIAIAFFALGSPDPSFGLYQLSWCTVHFVLGYILHKYEPFLIKYVRIAGVISIFAFPILLLGVPKANTSSFLSENIHVSESFKQFMQITHLYLVSLTGILTSYKLGEWLNARQSKLRTLFIYLGTISLEIYVTHYYAYFLVEKLNATIGDHFYVKVLLFTTLAIAGSDLFQRLVRYCKPLRKLLYGRD